VSRSSQRKERYEVFPISDQKTSRDGGGFTHGESEEEAGLADGGVADEEQLEEVVAASTRPVISPSDTIGNIEKSREKKKDRRPAAELTTRRCSWLPLGLDRFGEQVQGIS
jgi:hypothetical protein